MKVIKGDFSGKNKGKKGETPKTKKAEKDEIPESLKYADMLRELVAPNIKDEDNREEFEHLLNLGMVSWNLAVSKTSGLPGYQAMYDETMKIDELTGPDKKHIKQMMEAKLEKFPEHIHMMDNLFMEVVESGIPLFTVTIRSFGDFMINTYQDIAEPEEGLASDGSFINRNALVVTARPAFFKWCKTNIKGFEAPEKPFGKCIYLINEKKSDEELTDWIKQNFDKIFVNELLGWLDDEDLWPEDRTLKMFNDFFEVDFEAMVMDLEDEPISKD